MVKTSKIQVQSSDKVPEIIDITEKIEKEVEKSGIQEGQVLIFSQHTTAAIALQENEPGLLEDIKELLVCLCPQDREYKHSFSEDHTTNGEPPNAHSHLQQTLLGSSETIPVTKGKMLLGTFQRILLLELDRSRQRTITIQVIGE